jgi:hypothetical protein
VEEAFGIPVGTFDIFFETSSSTFSSVPSLPSSHISFHKNGFLCPQHRLKLIKYPITAAGGGS